jgi:hypothetical protein
MPTIDELKLGDDPKAWEALGFSVEGDSCDLGSVRVRFQQGTGITGWSLRDLQSSELDGLPTELSTTPEREPASAHPNGVAAIDHMVAISPSFQRSVEALQAAGLDLRRIRDEPTPAGAPRQAFFRLGAEILELVQEPDEAVEKRGGPDRPAHFWGLALLVDDLGKTLASMGEHASEARPAVQPGREIATLKRSAGLSMPVALITRRPSAD